MKSKIKYLLGSLALLFALAIVIYSCKKDKVVTADSEVAFFSTNGLAAGKYTMTTPTTVYKVPVGLTKIPEGSRTVAVTVTSPSGAVKGTQFNLNTTTLTFDKNKISDTIVVTGVQSLYLTGRLDTLVFTFTTAGDGLSTLNNKFTLAMRGPCLESDMTSLTSLLGAYDKTFENGSYGPYTSTIKDITAATATSAKAIITNIYDNNIEAVATFNWSTAGNFTVVIPSQQVGTLSGAPLFLRTTAPGKFTYCINTLTIPLELYTATGTFDAWTMTMAR